MLDPLLGPYLFDTSAEGWFKRTESGGARDWLQTYLARHPVHVSGITVFERARGYAVLWRGAAPEGRDRIEAARLAYLLDPGRVWPVDAGISVIAAEITALLPQPPAAPRRTHRMVESRQDRLVRWRFDAIIAATALAADMLLIHNNASDFEPIRSAIEQTPARFPGLGPLKLMRCGAVV
jgi:predicted nucleic acid-binding protein